MTAFKVMVGALLLVSTFISTLAQAQPRDFTELSKRLTPSVVFISTGQTITQQAQPNPFRGTPFEEFFEQQQGPQERELQGLGSGFVISSQGHIITNNHVIDQADTITVILHDDTELEAQVVGVDPRTDVAVLKVDPPASLTPLTWGDSSDVQVGEWVLAIGNPFGFGGTVTAGIVSAIARRNLAQGYVDFIQTDASINRGNSGGPLFNMQGEVIGVNTWIASPSGGSVGLGFAIPSNIVREVAQQMIEFGRTRRGWLGVRIQSVDEALAEKLQLESPKGALISSVMDDSPAQAAGIQAGDVVIRLNDREIPDNWYFQRWIGEAGPGARVNLTIWRDGQSLELIVTLGDLEETEATQLSSTSRTHRDEETGLVVSLVDPVQRQELDLPDNQTGLVITSVEPSSPAAQAGLRPREVIVSANREEIGSIDDFRRVMTRARSDDDRFVLLYVFSMGGFRYTTLEVDAR
ncbi:MAG: DegQ family serine endoprotease [Pseudomonadota bacterium]